MTWDFTHHVAVFNRAVATRQWGELVDLFDADAVMEFVGAPAPPVRGREAIAAAYAADGPDDTIELTGPVTREGAEEVVPYRWQGTGRTGTMRATVDGERLRRLVVTFDPDDGGADPVLDWLLDADPAIRWQAMRDLLHAPEAASGAERLRSRPRGRCPPARTQDEDGQWAGGAFLPPASMGANGRRGSPRRRPVRALPTQGVRPRSRSDRARRTVELSAERPVGRGRPAVLGRRVEECINGRTVADGAYFVVDITAWSGGCWGAHRGRRLELRASQRFQPLVLCDHHQRAGRAARV